MKNLNLLLAWVVIVLSLAVFGMMVFSYQPSPGEEYLRGLFVFLFLVPIGIAAGFLSGIETAFVGTASAVICGWPVIRPYYLAAPYPAGIGQKGVYGYLVYLGKPLFSSGIAYELAAFVIFSVWLGFLASQLREYSAAARNSEKAKQDIARRLERERGQFLSQTEKHGEDLTQIGSLIITLSDLAQKIPSVLEVDGLLKLLMDKATELFSAENCAIFHVDRASNKLIYACSTGYDKNTLTALKLTADEESGIAGWCAKTGKFLSFKDAESDPHMADVLRQNKFPVSFCQPIVQAAAGSVAVLCVDRVKKDYQDSELVRLGSLLANLSSIAIENARMMEKTKEQAIRDGLTGLYNHRYFYDLLDDMMAKPARQGAMIGILLMDIDHFKKFNDTYGHQVGDLILQETAEIIHRHIRENEIAARYGGEELAVICVRRDAGQIAALAEELRLAVESAELEKNGMKLRVTASIGVAFHDAAKEESLSPGDLVKRSDDALYKAKDSGRNRVCVWGK